MHIPSPASLGFPPKFKQWYPSQVDALKKLLTSQKRVKALAAPTGFGKTGVYIAYALITQRPTCFVTESRGLQDQLMRDFERVGLVDIRGRRNYQCALKADWTCEDGYTARCPYKGQVACPSSAAEFKAASSPLVVTNYDKWTTSKKFGQGMEHFQQVVFDEGHTAPFALARAKQIVLNRREIEEVLHLDFPNTTAAEEMVNWKPWAVEARAIAEEDMAQAKSDITSAGQDAKQAWIRHYLHLRNLTQKLSTLATAKPENWVVDVVEQKKGYVFDPIRVGAYAESSLLLNVPSVLLVSGTLREKVLWMLGIGRAHYDYWEFKSDFDPARCPIYCIPTLRVDRRAPNLDALWIKLDQLAARRTDRKGIVHTISYARRDEVLGRSRFAGRMLVNERGEASTSLVEQYKRSGPGTILVSPSVGAGYDFPYQDCEWQFVCKVPFPHSTKIIKARQEDDPEYGYMIAANSLEQICGRPMRAKDDQAETFIVDAHMAEWFYNRYKHLFSSSFRSRYRVVDTVPAPPPALQV